MEDQPSTPETAADNRIGASADALRLRATRMRERAELLRQRADQLEHAADSYTTLLESDTVALLAGSQTRIDIETARSIDKSYGEQLVTQLELFEYLGLLTHDQQQANLGYHDVGGQFRPLPNFNKLFGTLRDIYQESYREDGDVLSFQIAQVIATASQKYKYNNVRIIPIGMPLGQLVEMAAVSEKYRNMEPFTYDGVFYDGDRPGKDQIIYNPRTFSKTKHSGVTKSGLLSQPSITPGYQVVLMQPYDMEPELSDGLTPADYLSLAEHAKPSDQRYDLKFRSGLTPEMWLIDFIYNLHINDVVIDNIKRDHKPTALVGSYLPNIKYGDDVRAKDSGEIPVAFWHEDEHRFKLFAHNARSNARSNALISDYRIRYCINLTRIADRYHKHRGQLSE